MTITQLDKTAARTVAVACNEALRVALDQLGIDVKPGGLRYDSRTGTATFKCDIALRQTADGGDAARMRWDVGAALNGLKSEWFHSRFVFGMNLYRITGFEPKRRTRPVVCERADDGKTYLFSVETVKAYMLASEYAAQESAKKIASEEQLG